MSDYARGSDCRYSFSSYRLKNLKPLLCALALSVSIGRSQWLETTLTVPDSCGGMLSVWCFAYDSVDNRTYVGGAKGVIAIDGATDQKIARIPFGTWNSAICYNSHDNKAYSADGASDDVGVIDCATNSVAATVTVGQGPVALCYSPLHNRVYSADNASGTVSVIDGADNSLIATIAVGKCPQALCYNPQSDKVYCANDSAGTVTVIDCATNGVVATVTTGSAPNVLQYDAHDNKVFCANYHGNNVTVIDGAGDSVIATIAVGKYPWALCYNPQDDKVYSGSENDGTVTVLNGATDSVIATDTVATTWLAALCYDPLDNRVYCASANLLAAIDGSTNSVVAKISLYEDPNARPRALSFNPRNDEVYFANDYGNATVGGYGSVDVIDCKTDRPPVTTIYMGDQTMSLCYNAQDDKVYCADYGHGAVTVMDGATNSVITGVKTGASSWALCYNWRNNKVYCGCRLTPQLMVLDGATNQVIDSVHEKCAYKGLCYNTRDNKVYIAIGSQLVVMDGATDALVKGIAFPSNGPLYYNSANDRLYCIGSNNAVGVADGATDTIIANVPVGANAIALCSNYPPNKVYCSTPNNTYVIDCATDSVTNVIKVGGQLCCNIQNDRVYCAYTDSSHRGFVTVIDGRTDSVIATVAAGYGSSLLYYDVTNDRVYRVNDGGQDETGVIDSVTVINGWDNKVRRSIAVDADPNAIEWNMAQNRVYVANKMGSSVSVLRDYQGPPLGDLDVDPDSLRVVADTIRLRGAGSYAVGEFVLVNTSASFNPDPSDGPSQSPIDSFNYSCSLRGPRGTLDSIIIPHLSDSLVVGQGIVCSLSVYIPPAMRNGTYSGWVRVAGRDTAGMVVEARFCALVKQLGDIDIDPDSLDVVGDTIRVRSQSGLTRDMTELSSIRIVSQVRTNAAAAAVARGSAPSHVGLSPARSPVQVLQPGLNQTAGRNLTGYELGRFILVNTSASYNPDTSDGPSQSPVDSLRFTGSLTGSGETLDSIRIFNLPESLAQGQAVVCTLAVYVPDNLPNGDYSGPITITGIDSLHYEIAATAYAFLQKHNAGGPLGDLDVDPDSLSVKHDTMNLHAQPAGPNYSSTIKAEFMLVNTDSAYNPNKSDGPSRSKLRQVKVEAKVEAQNKTTKSRSAFHSSDFTLHSSSVMDSVYVLNLPDSLAVGQAVQCTLALVIPTSESLGSHSGWVVVSAMDTIGYQVQDSFFLKVTGPQPWKNLDSFRVAPIPFKPHQNPAHDAIHFWGLPAGARAIVYDASGQSVWSATASSDGQLKWDAKVASGIYVYLVVSADGKSNKVGKLSVIR
ncbi:MAG TPA: YncE family protein [bacterium]|nr:YncE family protein [bacterium]